MSRMLRCAPLLVISSLVLGAVGCASHEDAKPQTTSEKPEDPQPDPQPDPEPSVADQVEVAVASVQLLQDCPDPEPAPEAKAEAPAAPPAQGARAAPMKRRSRPAEDMAAGDSPEGFAPGWDCSQSTLQLAFTSKVDRPIKVAIEEIRIRKADDKKSLSTLKARLPTLWTNSKYETWDETLEAGATAKASYKLGAPDWSAVEKALGSSSFGPTYVLEIDVTVDGERRTIESAKIPREEPAQIVT